MNQKTLAVVLILFCLLAVPMTAFGESRTFRPPAEKGYVWVVVKHRKMYPPMDTTISIQWGRFSKQASINAGCFRYSCEGVVIRLTHSKNDSVPMTVTTDGSIVTIYQGEAPSQASNKNWQSKNW
ncbi:MAG: hypothetical protein IPK58_15395 [Acidobacteria bacterium]|nr:hypothetical protein [Acidobacteriota bacterium]